MKLFTPKKTLTTLPVNFDSLRIEADKITDLNQRELFYTELLTRHKQAINKGNIILQITDEIEFIQRTIQLSNIKKTPTEAIDNDNAGAATIKVRAAIMLETLKKMGMGMAHNDRTKICKLIAYVLGCSYNTIYRMLQEGINFNNYHSKEIDEANKILENLNASISIDKDKQY
jgi:hypothetical protein